MTDVTAKPSEDGKTLTIEIRGRFDFGAHQAFRDAYERVHPKPAKFIINLKDTNYLDSSALGMLLLLRDHAGGDHAQVQVIHSTPDVRKILGISNFDKLFNIS
ncbi:MULTISPECIES: STAS domain-containing protein [Pseudomonas]|uniref:STAS domain-containing protein n=1 Tax=Pseudomonas TaxID=286 RepID=UPI001CF9D1C3|nr:MULTISPECIES: STAS domain-containing protein [Pseudomonas]